MAGKKALYGGNLQPRLSSGVNMPNQQAMGRGSSPVKDSPTCGRGNWKDRLESREDSENTKIPDFVFFENCAHTDKCVIQSFTLR